MYAPPIRTAMDRNLAARTEYKRPARRLVIRALVLGHLLDQRPGVSTRSGFSTRIRSGFSTFSVFSGLSGLSTFSVLSTLLAFSALPVAEIFSTPASVALTLLFTEPRFL